jgi:hypothetical protein
MVQRTIIAREAAEQLLSEWAEQRLKVVLVVYRGELAAALITCWEGDLEVEREGTFRHTSGTTVNLVVTEHFTQIELVEEEHFPRICFRRGEGLSRLTILLGIQEARQAGDPLVTYWVQ